MQRGVKLQSVMERNGIIISVGDANHTLVRIRIYPLHGLFFRCIFL